LACEAILPADSETLPADSETVEVSFSVTPLSCGSFQRWPEFDQRVSAGR
jgi:hypothetical protein